MTIPVLILNLRRSTARREQISARLDALSISHRFFDAIDGRSLSPNELERLAPQSALLFERKLTPGEIGAAASHIAAIHQLANEKHDFACVMDDDAVMSADLPLFLEPEALNALPQFDVLRLVSDPARWKRPAWQIAHIHGRGIYAMARAGWGCQGQIYSRVGLRKMASQLNAVSAPADFMFYHDCHIAGLRIAEVRPGVIEHDQQEIYPELRPFTDVGLRPVPDRQAMSFSDRMSRRRLRYRRKFMAIRGFIQAWGLGGLFHVFSRWPPGSYFR